MRIVLIGASGFFGGYVLRALTAEGHECVALTRARTRRATVGMRPGVKLVQADVNDAGVLAAHFSSADAVVSMAGILNESGRSGSGFRKVHVELVSSIIEACRAAKVDRLLHVSALNAGKGDSHYLKTKGEAEHILAAADDLHTTIFQPSVIFGAGDDFFNRFAAILKMVPVLPLACPNARLQPVFAGDVAAAMVSALEDPMTWGKTYELAGPEAYTMKELVEWTARCLGLKRQVVGLPGPMSLGMAMTMEWVPGKPLSMDNYRSLQTDNVSDRNDFACFGIEPRSIAGVVPDYLAGSARQRRLSALRSRPPDR